MTFSTKIRLLAPTILMLLLFPTVVSGQGVAPDPTLMSSPPPPQDPVEDPVVTDGQVVAVGHLDVLGLPRLGGKGVVIRDGLAGDDVVEHDVAQRLGANQSAESSERLSLGCGACQLHERIVVGSKDGQVHPLGQSDALAAPVTRAGEGNDPFQVIAAAAG